MNPLLLLGPLGMILVGGLSIWIWKMKKNVSIKYFLFGGLIWFVAIIPKVILDYTVTSELNRWATTIYGLTGVSIILGAYVGLRTGVFECGFTYLTFSKSNLRELSTDEATAFGIGFGAFEAILIALPSLIQIAVIILNPSLLDSLPPTQRQIIEAQLSLPSWVIPAPIIERIFTMFVHLFTTLLIFISVVRHKFSYFLGAFIYKSMLDAAVPYIQLTFKPNVSPIGIYLAEVWVVTMGSIASAGIYWSRRVLSEKLETPLES